jgi:hypothetical protein
MRKEEWYMANISLEQAKSLMTKGSLEHLKDVVEPRPTINTSLKMNNDIIMAAFCTAVDSGVIKISSLDDRMVKLLNSPTNTLSAAKLGDMLEHLRKKQPNMACIVYLKKGGPGCPTMKEWVFTDNTATFNPILDYVLSTFDISPTYIRNELTKMLKVTIVNNVAQFVAKYEVATPEEKKELVVSISTITRLVNMVSHILVAEFVEI